MIDSVLMDEHGGIIDVYHPEFRAAFDDVFMSDQLIV
jgi:hypothetical protein